MTLISKNPHSNALITEYVELKNTEIDCCIVQAEMAFKQWKHTDIDARKDLILAVGQELEVSKEALSSIITQEMGKPIAESRAEIEKCIWVCRYYAYNSHIFLQREAVATDAHLAYIQYEPLGTILGIMPWNYPFWQVFRFAIPTLMAGNTVLLKHASNVQMCAKSIENIFVKAGLKNGVFQNLMISSSKINDVIEHPSVKGVSLTGSEMAGKSVAQKAGSLVKKSVLELGGNNAFIVLNDADIKKAVEIGVQARMMNSGQSCIAAKRFLIQADVATNFVNLFVDKISTLRVGDPMDEDTDMGPMVSEKQANLVLNQLEKSLKMGAQLVCGGKPFGAYFPPTVVSNVKPGMPLFDEEVFGPVAAITTFTDVEEAIELSNQSKYGLGVSLFTNNIDMAESIAPQFDDGAVFINSFVKSDPRLPFGGTKNSGYGRELAKNGILEFVNIKTLYIDQLHDQKRKKKEGVISVGKV